MGKRLVMHLPPPLQAAFEAMAGRVPGRLLCTPRGLAWKKVNAEETLLVLRQTLGIDRYVLHGLRTTAATAALELGFLLQEWNACRSPGTPT